MRRYRYGLFIRNEDILVLFFYLERGFARLFFFICHFFLGAERAEERSLNRSVRPTEIKKNVHQNATVYAIVANNLCKLR